jgi:class 3 adenylate cyclase/tetratricopeptide (TPR) repeat protein
MPTCANCGWEQAEDDFAFCPACGQALTPQAKTREVRKTVTAVFCDIADSTTLGEKLDPESLRRVLSRYFEEMRLVLERHGGLVEKFIGDAVMAVFGIPQAHEDDALRAVQAAGEMRETLKLLNKEIERDRGASIAVRIGVNTGEVMVGDPSSRQALVTGDAVNIASRLEQTANADEVLIGEDTFRLVRGMVVAEPLEPLALKGKSGKTRAYRLIEVSPEQLGRSVRFDSPMVGREHEMSLLRQAFDRAVSDQSCQLFTILGSAGVGKSRLVAELVDSIDEEARVLRGRCLPYGEGVTFFPIVQIVKQAAGLADFDDRDFVEAKICALLEGDEHQDAICRRVAALMGVAEVGAGEETLWAIRRMLEAIARDRPLLLILDDIHWAEATLLDLVEHIADWSKGVPILLVCTARPDLLEVRSGWGGGKLNAATILLEPLRSEECRRMIGNLLGTGDAPPQILERVGTAAEGNPLFVEEMVSMLIDEGVLIRVEGMWTPAADLQTIDVPPTISAVLATRLDRLSGRERVVVEAASVIGKAFFVGAVRALLLDQGTIDITLELMSLVRKELIRSERSTLPGEEAFRFRHQLIRDAAYGSMPKEARAEMHEQVANWLVGVAGDRIAEQEEIVGFHLEQAFRYRADLSPLNDRAWKLAIRAAEHLVNAGRRAMARIDVPAAANLLGRAVSLLPAENPLRLPLQWEYGASLNRLGRSAEAERVLSEVVDATSRSGDAVLESRARIDRWWARTETRPGLADEMPQEVRSLIPVLEQLGDDLGLTKAWQLIAFASGIRLEHGKMREAIEHAIQYARRAGDRLEESEALVSLLDETIWGPISVREGLRRCEAVLQEIQGDRRMEAHVLMAQGLLEGMQGDFPRARSLLMDADATLRDLGLEYVTYAGIWLSVVESLANEWVAAEGILKPAYDQARHSVRPPAQATVAALLARAVFAQGRIDEAEEFARVAGSQAFDETIAQVHVLGVGSRVLAVRGEYAEALRLAREGVALVANTDALWLHGNALVDLAEVLLAVGDPDDASRALQEAIRLYEEKGSLVSARTAGATLRNLTEVIS